MQTCIILCIDHVFVNSNGFAGYIEIAGIVLICLDGEA